MIANLITSEKSSRSCQSASSGVTRILIRPLVEILSGSFFEDILSGVCFSAAQPFGIFGASQRKDDLYYWLAYFPAVTVSIFSHIFGYGACTSVPNWWRSLVRFSTLRFLVSFSKGFARKKKNREGNQTSTILKRTPNDMSRNPLLFGLEISNESRRPTCLLCEAHFRLDQCRFLRSMRNFSALSKINNLSLK